MLSFELLGEIALFSACMAFVWVCLLTTPRGLFRGVTGIYPKLPNFIQHVLTCVPCLAGWLSILAVILVFNPYFTCVRIECSTMQIVGAVVLTFWDALRCGILAMTLGKIIQSFTEYRD